MRKQKKYWVREVPVAMDGELKLDHLPLDEVFEHAIMVRPYASRLQAEPPVTSAFIITSSKVPSEARTTDTHRKGDTWQ